MVTMKHSIIHGTLCLVISALLASCAVTSQRPVVNCEEVSAERFATFPFVGAPSAVMLWVQNESGLDAKDIRSDISNDGAQSMLKWEQPPNRVYGVTLWNDARESALAWMKWLNRAPALADALYCLGDPPLYRAYYVWNPEAVGTALELWYPERGLMVTAYVTRKTSDFTGSLGLENTSYVEPGQPEDLITRFFWAVALDSDRYTQILHGLKPWPGSIEDVTIDDRG